MAERLDEHVLDGDIICTDAGAWFAHDHPHHHGGVADEELTTHRHRHDHRRRSTRGNHDHHPLGEPGDG